MGYFTLFESKMAINTTSNTGLLWKEYFLHLNYLLAYAAVCATAGNIMYYYNYL